jgi:RimJ/RimL family protein N-acetyltransferase
MLNYIKSLSFKKIVATTRKENIASLKLLENVGFKLFPEKEINNCLFFEYLLEE